MASLVSSLVLAPQVSQALAVLATTIGRDKTYRLVQYVSRIVAWSFKRQGNGDAAARFDALKASLGQGRKLMRIFKPLENLQSALNIAERPLTGASGAQTLATATQFVRQLCYAAYLTSDTVIWLQFAKFLRLDSDKMAKINRFSAKAWFFGVVLSLVSSTASLVNLRAQSRRFALNSEVARREASEKPDAAAEEAERRKQGRALLTQRQNIVSQLVTDALDIWIPANNLGYTHFNDGLIGGVGAITSYMALQKSWRSHGAALASRKSA